MMFAPRMTEFQRRLRDAGIDAALITEAYRQAGRIAATVTPRIIPRTQNRVDLVFEIAEGRVEGHVVWPPRGDGGFGYDPMFVPEGETETFGEMAVGEAGFARKAAFSHRDRAFAALAEKCFAR